MNMKEIILNIPGMKAIRAEKLHAQYRAFEKNRRKNYERYKYEPADNNIPLVSIIIFVYNWDTRPDKLMLSLQSCSYYNNVEYIVVNYSSSNNIADYMSHWKKDFEFTIIDNKDGSSHTEIRNRAADMAKGQYLLFIDSTMQVTTGWLDELMKTYLNYDNAGVVGAKIIYKDTMEDASGYSKEWKINHFGIAFRDRYDGKAHYIQPYNIGDGRTSCGKFDNSNERLSVSGDVMLVSKACYEEAGGFDEAYIGGCTGSYYSTDLCLKLYIMGYNNYCCNDCLVYNTGEAIASLQEFRSDKKCNKHDAEVFKGRWHRWLCDKLRAERLEGKVHMFTEDVMTFTIVLSDDMTKSLRNRALNLGEYLQNIGYKVKYHNRENGKSNIDVKSDVLILFENYYDVIKINKVKDGLITYICKNDDWTNEYIIEEIFEELKKSICAPLDNKTIDICGAMPDNDNTKFWGDYHYALALKKEFEKQGFKANILSRENWYNQSNAGYIIVLRGVKEFYPEALSELYSAVKPDPEKFNSGEYGSIRKKYIMWNISHPTDVDIREYNKYDFVFFASERMRDIFKDKIDVRSGVLPQCTDPNVMTGVDCGEKKYELLFVGNSRKVYRQILKDLLPTSYDLVVYGRHWENYPVQEYVVRDYIDNNEVGQAYHDAKILLNDHWDDMKQYGIISNRIFDALSAGAFIISDNVPGMDDMLEGSVVVYDTADDLREKIAYYMEHDEEREAKALAGQKIVRERHTFAIRVKDIIEVIMTL